MAQRNTWVSDRHAAVGRGLHVMSAYSADTYRASRIMVWMLFGVGLFGCLAIGLVMGGQGLDHFAEEGTRTLGQGEIMMAGGLLLFGPMLLWVFKDACLAIFGFQDQAMALRREMNALASRPAASAPAAVVRPPAPWQCPDCEAENAMADTRCAVCGVPFGA